MNGELTAAAPIYVAGARTMIGAALVRRLRDACFTRLVGVEAEPDLTDARAVEAFFDANRPQFVFVVAGRSGGILANQRYPADLMLDNLLTCAHVLPAAWRHRTAKLLYLASSCTYPKHAPQPMRSESLWTGALEPTSAGYATAKLAGVRLAESFRRQHGARFISTIAADAFGPGDDFSREDSHVVGGLMRRLHDAKIADAPAVEIWGSGAPRREFIYVDDLADACIFAMRHYEGEAPLNLGTGVDTSIRSLAELIRDVVGYEGELRYDTARPDGMPLKALDSGPLQTMGWRPSYELRDALQRTYAWFLSAGAPA